MNGRVQDEAHPAGGEHADRVLHDKVAVHALGDLSEDSSKGASPIDRREAKARTSATWPFISRRICSWDSQEPCCKIFWSSRDPSGLCAFANTFPTKPSKLPEVLGAVVEWASLAHFRPTETVKLGLQCLQEGPGLARSVHAVRVRRVVHLSGCASLPRDRAHCLYCLWHVGSPAGIFQAPHAGATPTNPATWPMPFSS